MTRIMQLAALLALSAAAMFAKNWTGPLVDSKCYAAEQRNVNPTDTQTYVDRDTGYEIRYCSPSHKTKDFALVGPYGTEYPLDAAGNAKAAQLVKNLPKRHLFEVNVTGQQEGKSREIQVQSIMPVGQAQK